MLTKIKHCFFFFKPSKNPKLRNAFQILHPISLNIQEESSLEDQQRQMKTRFKNTKQAYSKKITEKELRKIQSSPAEAHEPLSPSAAKMKGKPGACAAAPDDRIS